MQLQNVPQTAPRSHVPATQKLSYAPPKVAFVPFKLEERVLESMGRHHLLRPCIEAMN
jgi:hypothetical protein